MAVCFLQRAQEPVFSLRMKITAGIDCIRGRGLLGLHIDDDLTDWAQVTGQWVRGTNNPQRSLQNIAGLLDGYMSDFHLLEPVFFNISAVPGPDQVVRAMRKSGLSDGIVRSAWKNLEPYIGIHLRNPALPPVYFHGFTGKRRRRAGRFIYGLVHLTNDSPPEMRWVIAFHALSRTPGYKVIVGVQLGGRGARRGVVGVSLVSRQSNMLILAVESCIWWFLGPCSPILGKACPELRPRRAE
jgi:hypothetical protein